jgi:hypothetical protein
MLSNIVNYGVIIFAVGLVLLGIIEGEIAKSKTKEAKKLQLIKIKAEIYAESKKLQFEEYRNYIENKYRVVEEEEVCVEVDETFQEVTLLEGVQQLRDNGHKYVPYVRVNPLDDIRSSLSEFTVSDVLRTFY